MDLGRAPLQLVGLSSGLRRDWITPDLCHPNPLPDRLRRPATKPVGDGAHRFPVTLAITNRILSEPHCPLPKLGRTLTPLDHAAILPKGRSLWTRRSDSAGPGSRLVFKSLERRPGRLVSALSPGAVRAAGQAQKASGPSLPRSAHCRRYAATVIGWHKRRLSRAHVAMRTGGSWTSTRTSTVLWRIISTRTSFAGG